MVKITVSDISMYMCALMVYIHVRLPSLKTSSQSLSCIHNTYVSAINVNSSLSSWKFGTYRCYDMLCVCIHAYIHKCKIQAYHHGSMAFRDAIICTKALCVHCLQIVTMYSLPHGNSGMCPYYETGVFARHPLHDWPFSQCYTASVKCNIPYCVAEYMTSCLVKV